MTLSKILGEKAAKYGVKCCTISLRLDVWARNVTGVLPCFSEHNTAHVRWSAEERAAKVIVAILGNLLCQMLTLLSLFAYGLVFGIEPMHNTQVITRWVSWTYRSYGHSECLGLQLCYHWLVWLPCYLWISGYPPLLCYLWIPCDWRLLPISTKSQPGTACTLSPGYLFNRRLCLEFKYSLKNRAAFHQKDSVQQNTQQPKFLHKSTKKQMLREATKNFLGIFPT